MVLAKLKGYVQGLKWAGLKELLFEVAVANHLSLTILDEEKGLLRTTLYYQVEGEEQAVRKFSQELRQAAEEYNRE